MRWQPNIALTGFDEALAGWLAEGFAFTAVPGARLVDGRSLFVEDLPEEDDIARTAPSGYNPDKEPALCLYTEPGPGFEGAMLRGDVKHEETVRLVLRHGVTPLVVKRLLEEVVDYVLRNAGGAVMGRFVVKRTLLIFRPVVTAREGDDHVYAAATLRFKLIAHPA